MSACKSTCIKPSAVQLYHPPLTPSLYYQSMACPFAQHATLLHYQSWSRCTPAACVPESSCFSHSGDNEVLKENARDLTWDAFSKADLRVGGITNATCEQQDSGSSLQQWYVTLDFGQQLGCKQGKAILDSKVFKSKDSILNRQVLAVTNLLPSASLLGTSTEAAVLTVAGKALLQPAKEVTNGYKLA